MALLFVATLVVPFTVVAASEGDLPHTALFARGMEGYHTFRIPSLIVTKKGTLLALCEGRKTSRHDFGDLDIMVRRSTDLGQSWSDMTLVYEEGGAEQITIGNPCAVVDQSTGTIYLACCRNNNDVLITQSTDDGLTWAVPKEITKDVKDPAWIWYATGPGVGIQLVRGPHAGRLLIPSNHNTVEGQPSPSHRSHVFYSDDHGKTWQLGGVIEGKGIGESQLVELADGAIMANIRGTVKGQRAVAVSADGGSTWGKTGRDETLIECAPGGCQGSILRYTDTYTHDKNRILFSNPAHPRQRLRMTVRLSYDEGKTWPIGKLIHEGPAGYSCLAVLPDGRIGLLYERGEKSFRETVSFTTFSLAWLSDGQDTID